jgi:hypothetical protein
MSKLLSCTYGVCFENIAGVLVSSTLSIYFKMTTAKNELQEYYQKRGFPLPEYHTIEATPQPNLTWRSTVSILNPYPWVPRGITQKFSGQAHASKIQAELSAAKKAVDWLRLAGGQKMNSREERKDPNTILTRVQGPLFYTSSTASGTPDSKSRMEEINAFDLVPIENAGPSSRSKSKSSILVPGPTPGAQTRGSTGTSRRLKRDTVLLVDVENIPKIIETYLDKYPTPPENFWIYAFVGKHHPQASILNGSTSGIVGTHPHVSKFLSPSTRKDGTDTYMQIYVGALLYDETFEEYLICTRDHFGGTLVEIIQSNEPGQPWRSQRATLVTCLEHIENSFDAIGFQD